MRVFEVIRPANSDHIVFTFRSTLKNNIQDTGPVVKEKVRECPEQANYSNVQGYPI